MMKKSRINPACYIVVEEVTGLIDGYYSKEEAIEMVEHWDMIRPQNKHFMFGGFKNPYKRMRLTENLYLPKINREEDPYIHTKEMIKLVCICHIRKRTCHKKLSNTSF